MNRASWFVFVIGSLSFFGRFFFESGSVLAEYILLGLAVLIGVGYVVNLKK